MKSEKLNIAEREQRAQAMQTNYTGIERMSRAKAMPTLPVFRCKVVSYTEQIARRVAMEQDINSHAHRAVYGMLKKLTANSGISKDGKRPTTANDPNSRIYAIRSELCKYDGLDGIHKHGEQGREPLNYWERVDLLAERIAEHERNATENAESASAYAAAATAAKRAGNMEQYNSLVATRNAYRKVAAAENAQAAEFRKNMDTLIREPLGEGVELFNAVYAYYWERIAVNGLTWDSLCEGYANNGRRSVRPVSAWGYIIVRRMIRANAAARTQTANGYSYFSVEEYEQNGAESEYYHKIKRTPKYWDDTPVLSEQTPVETADNIADIINAMNLSEQQRRILHMRLQGMSLHEIADNMGVKRQSVQTQLKRVQKSAAAFFSADLIAKYIK